MHDLWRTIKYASKFRFDSAYNFFLALITAGLGLVPPIIYKLYFDLVEITAKKGIDNTTYENLLKYSILYAVVAALTIILNRVANYQWVKWMNITEKSLNEDAFNHIQGLSLDYFSNHQTGMIIERISQGVGDIIRVMQSVLFQIFPQFVIFLVTTVVLFRINWIFGIITGLGIPLYVAITLAFNKKIIGLHDDMRRDYEGLGAVRAETIYNIKTIKSYVQERAQLKKFSKFMSKKVSDNMSMARAANVMLALRGISNQVSLFVSMAFGIYLVLNENITLGSFVLVWSYVNKVYEPMNYLSRTYDDIIKQMRSVKKLFDTLDTKPTVVDSDGAKDLRFKKGEIILRNVRFSYPDNSEKGVIKGINFRIEPGKTIALVGKSGSGKTTMAKLLMRFYDVTGGSIIIDGQDIREVTQDSLRRKIGYVLQDSDLFNDSAFNNILFGKPGAGRENVVKAAKLAFADAFITALPKGYTTIIGEKGVKLSGGEQQRINIARAILKDAPILILDEATSSLDSESEVFIQEALSNLLKDKTTIIIAHRLSTVMRADLIAVMDKGKITEIGTHNDLIEKKGIYSKLFEIQSGGYLK